MPANDVSTLVKLRLSITDTSLDALIDSYVAEIGQRIRHYCNIDEIPPELESTWAAMVVDVLRLEQGHLAEVGAATPQTAEVTIGDTTVRNQGPRTLDKTVVDQVVANYRIDLARYRRLRW